MTSKQPVYPPTHPKHGKPAPPPPPPPKRWDRSEICTCRRDMRWLLTAIELEGPAWLAASPEAGRLWEAIGGRKAEPPRLPKKPLPPENVMIAEGQDRGYPKSAWDWLGWWGRFWRRFFWIPVD